MAEGTDSAGRLPRVVTARPGGRWHQSLWLRLLLLGVIGWLLFTAGAVLLQDQTGTGDADRDAQALQRMALQFDGLTQTVQALASQLSQWAAAPDGLATLRTAVPGLIQHQMIASSIVSVGVWPLPNTLDPSRERASLVWLRQSDGTLAVREDYNDARTVPYVREKWFTPARYSPGSRCHWTAAYADPLSRKSVVTCTAPVRIAGSFIGAVSLSLDAEMLARQLEEASHGGAILLTTLGGDVVAAAGSLRQQAPRNLAEVGRQDTDLSPLALALHRSFETIAQAVAPSPAMVAALKRETRDLSQDEAIAALVGLALTAPPTPTPATVKRIPVAGSATVTQFSAAGQWWTLLLIHQSGFGIPGLDGWSKGVITLSLAMLGFVVLLLWALRLWVLNPIHELTAQIAAAANARDTQRPAREDYGGELGLLAHWHNESLRLQQVQHLRSAQQALSSGDRLEQRSANDQLARARERSLSALRAMRDGVIIFNEQGRVEELNLVAEKLIGLTAAAAAGKPFGEVLKIRPSGEVKTAIPELADLVLRQKAPMDLPHPVLLTDANGSTHSIRAGFHPVLTRQGHPAGCIAVLWRTEAARELGAPDTMRRTPDGMTGLPMRNACETDIRLLLADPAVGTLKPALLFVDADDLKRINDAEGQRAGDDVVIQIAGILNNLASKNGHTAYRLYGDQFAILMRQSDAEKTARFAEDVCSRFSAAALRGSGRKEGLRITVSVGTCLFDGSSADPAELIRRGELACTTAKKLGGNRVQKWEPSAQESKRQADESLWLKRIRAGLDRDMFHLTTQYLAPADAAANPLHGFQILLALEDEEGFWSTPTAFMPTAQRHDLTGELDRWLIRHSVQQLREKPDLMQKVGFISIRLSDSAIADNELLESLVQLFSGNAALPATKFCFELSEHALHLHPHSGSVFCEVLRNLGCKLSIDGFVGRRTSDIAQFRKLSVDFIRIDTSQFPNVDTDSIERMLTESLISVARALCKHIIASNVDSPDKLQAWRQLGADYLQGNAVAKASPVLFLPPV